MPSRIQKADTLLDGIDSLLQEMPDVGLSEKAPKSDEWIDSRHPFARDLAAATGLPVVIAHGATDQDTPFQRAILAAEAARAHVIGRQISASADEAIENIDGGTK